MEGRLGYFDAPQCTSARHQLEPQAVTTEPLVNANVSQNDAVYNRCVCLTIELDERRKKKTPLARGFCRLSADILDLPTILAAIQRVPVG
jgi:hypothetical protein